MNEERGTRKEERGMCMHNDIEERGTSMNKILGSDVGEEMKESERPKHKWTPHARTHTHNP